MRFQLSNLTCVTSVIAAAVVAFISLPAHADTSTRSEATPATTTQSQPSTQTAQAGTIVDIAASNSAFTTLVQAVQAAGLVETLSGDGPFTVFAPTNEAFAALPPGTLETLLRPENRDTLRQILTYHVVAGAVESSDIQPGEVTTVQGSPVNLNVANGQVTVNDATVRAADITASNGVIHVIDRVILPPGF
ncbi:MAG: fasciclin domain-containing protein [Oculatellaceae cyanobacterium bins.114]|nr:fasciclin domain-containing protein [Oculatellaceae cyanobacterium bins.114]